MKRETVTTALIFCWSLAFAHIVRAATLSEFIGTYDKELIFFAAAAAVLGGWIRTILSLQSDARVVRQIFAEAAWDTIKALLAGMFVFGLIQALRAAGYAIPSEVRFGAVVVAGWSRWAAVEWLTGLAKNYVAAKAVQASDAPLKQEEKS